MKIEINPATGLITAEIEDNSSAASFVRELLSGHAVPAPKAIESKRVAKPAPKKRRRRKLATPRPERQISKPLDETWAWMAAADRPEGITAREIAGAFDLTNAGATWRINRLIERDMVWLVSRGRYRVGSAHDAEVLLNGSR